MTQLRTRRTNAGVEASRQALALVTMIASAIQKGWSLTTVARQLDVWVQSLCNERLELAARSILAFDGFEAVLVERRQFPHVEPALLAIQAAIGRGVGNHIYETTSFELRRHFAAVVRTLKTNDAVKPGPKHKLASMTDQATAEIAAMASGDPPVRS